MENQYKINFKKYRQYCKENSIEIPRWLNPIDFKEVVRLMSEGLKLQACKYLCDRSKENLTRGNDGKGFDFGLKWSKMLVCDVIDNFKVIQPDPINHSIPPKIVNVNEVRELLAPFKTLADEVLASVDNGGQPVIGISKVGISLDDLRKVVAFFEKTK